MYIVVDCNSFQTGSGADDNVSSLIGDLEMINTLGWLELIIVLVAISSAIYDRVKEDKVEETDHNLMQRVGLAVSLVAVLVDVLLSSIDFFKFTLDSNDGVQDLFASITNTDYTTDTSNSWKKCLFMTEDIKKAHAISATNCFEDVNSGGGAGGLAGWEVSLIILVLFWLIIIGCAEYYRLHGMPPALKSFLTEKLKVPMAWFEWQEDGGGEATSMELTSQVEQEREKARKMKEDQQRKEEEIRKKAEDVKKQKEEIERMKNEYDKIKSTAKAEKEKKRDEIRKKSDAVERLSTELEKEQNMV